MSQPLEAGSSFPLETSPEKELARRFWLLWRQGQKPDVRQFLREAGPIDPLHLVFILRIDQRERWAAHESPVAEDYLLEFQAQLQDHPEAIIDLIFSEFLLREEMGEKPTLAEYVRRFPQHASALQQQVELHLALGPGSMRSGSRLATLRLRPGMAPASPPPGDRPASRMDGPRVAGFEIQRELGRGGMGVVYLAQQLSLKRLVALKMILAGKHAGQEELGRFRSEAEAAARLQHPNIVQIHEVGEQDGRPYFSLEYVDGGNLAQKLKGSPQSPRAAAQMVATLASAMHYAHQRGIVHRDLKPANVLLTRDGAPKIVDFGLAKHLDTDNNQTRSGAIVGTPSYMAPEQAEGRVKDIGPATDVCALGSILYEMLTGRPPFQGETPLDTLFLVRFAEPVAPRRLQPKVPRDLEVICLKCLRKDPRQRYATAEELADDLNRFLHGEPIQARPISALERGYKWLAREPWAITLIFSILLICFIGVVALFHSRPREFLIAVLVPVASLGLGGLFWQWRKTLSQKELAEEQRQQAEAARREAEQQRQQAEAARREAEDQARRASAALAKAETNLYFHSIALAERAWLASNVQRAEELLDACPRSLCRWEWHYLKWLCHASLLTLHSQNDWARGACFSPDRERLATAGGKDRTVRLWETRNGQELLLLDGHGDCVHCVAFSPDGQLVASGSEDQTIKLWNATTGRVLRTLTGHADAVLAVAFSPDGKRLASASKDHAVWVWDVQSGRKLGALTSAHVDSVTAVAFSPDGQRLATASTDRFVKVWDARTGQPIAVCRGHKDCAWSVCFSPDGSALYSASSDRTIRVWDPETGDEVRNLRGHGDSVLGVACSPDGRNLATCSKDQTIKIWDTRTGEEIRTLRGHTDAVTTIAYSNDGQCLVTTSRDQSVKVWDATSGLEAFIVVRQAADPVTRAAFHPDGRRLALLSGALSGQVQVWDTRAEQALYVLGETECSIGAMAFSPDGKQIAAGGGDLVQGRGEVKVHDADTGSELFACPGHGRPVVSLAYSPDGRRLATASGDGTVKVWNARTGQVLLNYRGHTGPVTALAFAPSGRRIASASVDLTRSLVEIRVWDAHNAHEVHSLVGHTERVTSLAYSPDGLRLASSSSDQTIRIWDTQAGRELLTLRGHTGEVANLVFSPDGYRLVSAGLDHTIKVWDSGAGQEILTLHGHLGPVNWVTFSPDGWCLVSASDDLTVKIWDAAPWEPGSENQSDGQEAHRKPASSGVGILPAPIRRGDGASGEPSNPASPLYGSRME